MLILWYLVVNVKKQKIQIKKYKNKQTNKHPSQSQTQNQNTNTKTTDINTIMQWSIIKPQEIHNTSIITLVQTCLWGMSARPFLLLKNILYTLIFYTMHTNPTGIDEEIAAVPTNMLLQTVKQAKTDQSQKWLSAWHFRLKRPVSDRTRESH